MLKKKPIIVALGCSFADPKYKSRLEFLPPEKRGGWPAWPEHFKNKLEKRTGKSYELANLARSGFGHDYMFKVFTEYFAKNKDRIEIVLWGGTQFHRRLEVASMRAYNAMATESLKAAMDDKGWHLFCEAGQHLLADREFTLMGMQNNINWNFSFLWSVLNICNSNKTKFLFYQLLTPYPSYEWLCDVVQWWGLPTKQLNKNAMSKPWQNEFMLQTNFAKDIIKNRKSFMGCQMLGDNPWDIQSKEERKKLRVYLPEPQLGDDPLKNHKSHHEAKDGHPNAAGHEDIANKIWKHYVHNLA